MARRNPKAGLSCRERYYYTLIWNSSWREYSEALRSWCKAEHVMAVCVRRTARATMRTARYTFITVIATRMAVIGGTAADQANREELFIPATRELELAEVL